MNFCKAQSLLEQDLTSARILTLALPLTGEGIVGNCPKNFWSLSLSSVNWGY